MKYIAFVLLLIPALGFATTVEYRDVLQLRAREAQLQASIAEVRWLYQKDPVFVAAFDASQKKWEEYCAAVLEARFPAKKKQQEYGSAYELAYAVAKIGIVEARIREVSLWSEGTEEGDISKGSVKLKKELDGIRKSRKG